MIKKLVIQKVNIQKQAKMSQETPQNPMMPAWNQVILTTKVVVMALALQRLVMAFAKTPMTPMVMALAPLAMGIVITAKTPMPVVRSPKEKTKAKRTSPITLTAKARKMRMPRKRLKTVSQALFLRRMK
ncbi:cobalamin biosynthesis domain protein (plasmid) [Yersinia pestis CO92]|nr:cobalamin biosynthesis domain protein [Yersinia pestis CO92]